MKMERMMPIEQQPEEEKEQGAEKRMESAEILEKMEQDEKQMFAGVLSRWGEGVKKAPKIVKLGIAGLMAAGVIASRTEAQAGGYDIGRRVSDVVEYGIRRGAEDEIRGATAEKLAEREAVIQRQRAEIEYNRQVLAIKKKFRLQMERINLEQSTPSEEKSEKIERIKNQKDSELLEAEDAYTRRLWQIEDRIESVKRSRQRNRSRRIGDAVNDSVEAVLRGILR